MTSYVVDRGNKCRRSIHHPSLGPVQPPNVVDCLVARSPGRGRAVPGASNLRVSAQPPPRRGGSLMSTPRRDVGRVPVAAGCLGAALGANVEASSYPIEPPPPPALISGVLATRSWVPCPRCRTGCTDRPIGLPLSRVHRDIPPCPRGQDGYLSVSAVRSHIPAAILAWGHKRESASAKSWTGPADVSPACLGRRPSAAPPCPRAPRTSPTRAGSRRSLLRPSRCHRTPRPPAPGPESTGA